MARWTIRRAVDVLALMRVRWPVTWPTLSGRIVLTAADLAQLASVADATAIGFDPKTDLFEHFAGLLTLGVVSIRFPQLLGNGKDVSGLTSINKVPFATVLALLLLKPLATFLCLGTGAPGGLFKPSLTVGALLGDVLGQAWSWLWPGAPAGEYALVGAAAVLAATTQGPISAVVLMMELTGRDRSFIVPLLLGVATATVVSRPIERRSIYDARLTDAEVRDRMNARNPA